MLITIEHDIIVLCKTLYIFYMVECDFLRLTWDGLEREKISAKIGEKFWEENGGWLWYIDFFKILGEYTIILGMENGFVMIEKFKKFVGQYIKEKGER